MQITAGSEDVLIADRIGKMARYFGILQAYDRAEL